MKETINNIKVNFTKADAIYKKDLAEILAIRVLQQFTSMIGNIDCEIKKAELSSVTDNYKVKLDLKTNSSNIYRIVITYVFRKNSEVKAYATLYSRIMSSIECPGEDTKFDTDDLENAILFNTVPDIHNKVELNDFVAGKLIPQCKKFEKEVVKAYKAHYY